VGWVLSPASSAGYPAVVLYDAGGKRRTTKVHWLVAGAFIGERPPGFHTNHIDGDKTHNTPSNLEYIPIQENAAHGVRTGLYPKGERHGRRKLTEQSVGEIRNLLRSGKLQRVLAARYGVSVSAIKTISQGRSWSHVT